MRRVALISGLVFAMLLSGCGSDAKKARTDSGHTSSSSTSTTTSSPTSTTAACSSVGSTDPKQNALASVDQLLTDVQTGTDGCIDTVTFTFRASAAPAPSYRIEYADPPFTNSAGDVVTPAGTVFLRIRFQPSWIADLSQESAPATYTGPKVITPTGLKSVRGLALFDAFEGVVGWAVGLDAKHPFTVEATPAKVVVKIG
ncbi:MAG: AMIN-like domain-containing (lipo)protein [Acidimicrobiia bacterium]